MADLLDPVHRRWRRGRRIEHDPGSQRPFAKTLFQDFLFSGFALLIVNGLTNLTAAVLLLRRKKLGVILGGVFGVTLMLWICIQFYMFPLNFMSTAYFIFGLCQALTGYGFQEGV